MTLWGMMVFLQAFLNPNVLYAQSENISEANLNQVNFDDGEAEDLVLAVVASQHRLSSGIFAIQKNGRYYLPMLSLSDILNFSIDVDAERGVVTGWALSEDKNYLIDVAQSELEFNGHEVSLPRDSILDERIADDDIYVLSEILTEIWPVDMEINLSSLVLKIIPDDKLPFERMLERRKRQEELERRQELAVESDEVEPPFAAYPYQLYGPPTIDMSVAAGYNARQGGGEFSYSFSGVQDLGYASADYSIALAQTAGKFNKPDNLRLRFTRQNIHDGALPLGLEEVQWGDVNLRSRELIANNNGGRGLIFSTRANNFGGEFDRITVEGLGTPGWETELYLNDQLINFGVVDTDGVYRFEDVEIGYGNNRVRVVLYGPQGQIHENVESYFYQSNMVRAGENEFSGGIVDAERDLIPIEKRNLFRPEGLTANIYGARGISRNLTVFGSANTVKDRVAGDDVSQKYLTAGAIASFDSTLVQGEVYKQLNQGQAVDLRTISDFKGFKINTQTSYYKNFESPTALDGLNAKKFEFEFDIKKIFATAIGSLGLEVGMDHLKRVNDSTITSYNTRQSLGLKGTRFANTTTTRLNDGSHGITTGRFSSTSRYRKWRLRNALNYQLYPDVSATAIQSELRYGLSRDYSVAFSAQRNFDSKENILGFQISKDFQKFLGSVDADWSSDNGASIMLRASTSFGPYATDGSYIMQSRSLRNVGPVSSFVFLDNDYDGEYSEGDEPIPNTKIEIARRVTKEETDETGYVTELNSISNREVDVKVSTASIDDPYLVPANAGYRIYPRPGVMHALELPLIETGAIDGTLRWNTGKPIGGLILDLMNTDGDIIQKSKTAADGYFTFERIPPGSYTIRANPETGMNIPFKYVELTPDNLFQFGQDIEAVDLTATADVDLNMGVEDNGLLKVKDIISIAKGYKESKTGAPKNAPKPIPMVLENKSQKDQLQEEPVQENKTSSVAEQANNLIHKISQTAASLPVVSNVPQIQEVRIGEFPDKVRAVFDLSAPIKYSLDFDVSSNTVFIEIPYAAWATDENWQASKEDVILRSYGVEKLESGVRVVMNVKNGVKIGASGVLGASGDKKDRLYIDIEQK